MRKVKVLVVDDSAFMRKAVSRIIESDMSFKVIATASDGYDALDKIKQMNPDVVTLDVEMPKLNGLETLKKIRESNFMTPVIIVSSITKFGTNMAIRCLEAGAFEIVRKPESYVSMDIHKISADLLAKLNAAVKIKPNRFSSAPVRQAESSPKTSRSPFQQAPKVVPKRRHHTKSSLMGGQKVVTIGSSTGGPMALQKILTALPADFPAGLVIVQHMPQGNFIQSLAERLNSYSQIEIRTAQEGDIVEDGVALIGIIGKHVVFEKTLGSYRIHLTPIPRDARHTPSVDVLFQSAGEVIGDKNISCILTGMGSDGAHGLEAVHKNGGHVIAESEETCVVYGMPRSAVEAGYVNEIRPLHIIPNTLVRLLE